MLITEKGIVISKTLFFSLSEKKENSINGGGTRRRRRRFGAVSMAKKREFSENLTNKKQPILSFKFSKKILSQSVVAVLGLGFIDAGYSGDWTRIGVISKDIEDLLKIAALLVVPLCLFLIYYISKKTP